MLQRSDNAVDVPAVCAWYGMPSTLIITVQTYIVLILLYIGVSIRTVSTDYELDGPASNPGGDEIFARPDRPWGQPSLLRPDRPWGQPSLL